MAAIYQEIEIEWEGKTYKVTPTYRMIQRIEQTISITHLAAKLGAGEAPLSQLADLLSIALREAGCKSDSAKAEEIFAALMSDEDAKRLMASGAAVLFACFPQRKLPGNAKAPKAAGARSTGESTTGSQSATSESSPPNSGG